MRTQNPAFRALLVLPLMAGACARTVEVTTGDLPRATIVNAQGTSLGALLLTESESGVRIRGSLQGVPAGAHGFHVHMTGVCTPPFASAGGHFNPTAAKHGRNNAAGPHAGDLPNVSANSSGAAEIDIVTRDITLGAGASSVFDTDGSALVLHAAADDNVTDPSGNSGDRIACGVIQR